MALEKTPIYENAIALLERINVELKDHPSLETINSKMIGVVKDLNEVRISEITSKNNG
jgi:hypothetical protein